MKKVVISVLGQDRPGIIAAVTDVLFKCDCNLENVSQTILQSEFSGIFIASMPLQFTAGDLQERLRQSIGGMDLHVRVKHLEPRRSRPDFAKAESFVITSRGPDRKGLVANITGVIARHGVNVTNLQAVFKGGDDPDKNMMIYEVDIPETTDQRALQDDLRKKAAELGLKISIQHRDIFKAINRI